MHLVAQGMLLLWEPIRGERITSHRSRIAVTLFPKRPMHPSYFVVYEGAVSGSYKGVTKGNAMGPAFLTINVHWAVEVAPWVNQFQFCFLFLH